MRITNNDLEHVFFYAKKDFLKLKKANIFISGGTGYVGKWLLETFLYANTRLCLKSKVILLTRNPKNFALNFPHLSSDSALSIMKGDIRNFRYPKENIDFVIHGATDIAEAVSSIEMFNVIIDGTRHLLNFSQSKNVKDVLLLSSGAIYGKTPNSLKFISENYEGRPFSENINSVYGLAKLVSECLATTYSVNRGMRCKYARIFAQVGPFLPLNKHFAAGNLILDCIKNRNLLIKGDGKSCRSYMYSADLAIWLWGILIRGKSCTAYNVGSDEPITIKNLARKISTISGIPKSKIKILHKPYLKKNNSRYVPDISRAKNQLSLKITIPLNEAFSRTIKWYKIFNKKTYENQRICKKN